jgi:hypothetical protein
MAKPAGGAAMKRYLLAIHQPGGPPPAPQALERIMESVEALRDEMRAAGVWIFSGGLQSPSEAKVLRLRDGKVLATDGPFAESKEHLGGFTIVQAPDLEAALEWGRKLARATTLPIEVREFQEGG